MKAAPDAVTLRGIAEKLLPSLAELGRELLRLRDAGLEIREKTDHSVVTNADFFADDFLRGALTSQSVSADYISEESAAERTAPHSGLYWCVDPLDATSDYTQGGGDFAVNIALIDAGKPVFGLIHLPHKNLFYYGAQGAGAFKISGNGAPQALQTGANAPPWRIVVSSKSHGHAERLAPYIKGEIASVQRLNGPAKFAMVAENSANLYPRFTRIREWDIAAGHAIVLAAGGTVTDLSGKNLVYGQDPHYRCSEFIARARQR